MEKLSKTRDYSIFKFMKGQRPVDMDKPEFRILKSSMDQYGFLPSKPIQARPNGDGRFEIVDGQHRYTAAKELGIDVYYVIDETDIDVSLVNHAQRKWTPEDYANSFASQGIEQYQTLLDYHHSFRIPITISAAILMGTQTFANVSKWFYSGRLEIRNRDLAIGIGVAYREICTIVPHAKKNAFIVALYRSYFVDYFDPERLISGIKNRPQIITKSGNVEMYAEQIEECYNFNRKDRKPLKFDTDTAMHKRSAANRHFKD